MKRRVVVTGVGVVAPNGTGREAYWQALAQGLSGVRSIRRFDSSMSATRIAGEALDLDPLAYFEPHELKKVDRSNVLAMAAGLEAYQDARLDVAPVDPERVGSSIGNAVCGIEYAQKESEIIYGKGPRWGSPYLAIAFFPCGSNGLLSIRLNMKGPVLTFCNGNTSATDAIGMAYRMVRNGKADVMLAGGTEAPLIPLFVGSLSRDGWLSRCNEDPAHASRPFDQNADGMVLSEGAGVLVLEEEAHARARGAHIYAELCGYSTVNSACSILDPEPDGLGIVRTMHDVLREEHLQPSDIDWIHAQGFSIPAFDQMEMRCMRRVCPNSDNGPRVSAVSSLIGNSIGALGGLQAVAIALALDRQALPGQGNLDHPHPENALHWAGAQGEKTRLQVALQNSYCFMGKNSSLLYRRAA